MAAALVGCTVLVAYAVPLYRAQQWTQWIIYGLLALSFMWAWGHGGIFSFGQVAFFGLGGYSYAMFSINVLPYTNESITGVVVGLAVAALVAFILGYFMFYGKVTDVYVAILTLAFALVLYTFLASTAGPQYRIGAALLGGYNGVHGVPVLTWGWAGGARHELSIRQMMIFTGLAAVAISFGVVALRRSSLGRIVSAVRENERRTELLGYDVRKYKLVTFVIGGAIAGLAGTLYAAWGMFIDPSVFSLQLATIVVIWVLVGGRGSVLGAFVGVFLIQAITSRLGETGSNITPIVLGAILIVTVLAIPAGIVPTFVQHGKSLIGRLLSRAHADPSASSSGGRRFAAGRRGTLPPVGTGSHNGLEVEVRGVGKVFGGVAAVDDISLRFPSRGVFAIIGPNGAGKSTLFGLLTGSHKPSAGEVLIGGRSASRKQPYRRVREGIAIKLQVVSQYLELSVQENLWLAAYGRNRNKKEADERTNQMLEWLDMSERATEVVGSLSHGEQQWLDLAMVLAGEPRVILLDEPTAGLTVEESSVMAGLITELAERALVIVVEHNMAVIRQLAAPVTVLHQGRVFASGTISEIRENEQVLDIYLGRGADAGAS